MKQHITLTCEPALWEAYKKLCASRGKGNNPSERIAVFMERELTAAAEGSSSLSVKEHSIIRCPNCPCEINRFSWRERFNWVCPECKTPVPEALRVG